MFSVVREPGFYHVTLKKAIECAQNVMENVIKCFMIINR